MSERIIKTCKRCNRPFSISEREQDWLESKNLKLFSYCSECRAINRGEITNANKHLIKNGDPEKNIIASDNKKKPIEILKNPYLNDNWDAADKFIEEARLLEAYNKKSNKLLLLCAILIILGFALGFTIACAIFGGTAV